MQEPRQAPAGCVASSSQCCGLLCSCLQHRGTLRRPRTMSGPRTHLWPPDPAWRQPPRPDLQVAVVERQLALTTCAHVRIGSPLERGISGTPPSWHAGCSRVAPWLRPAERTTCNAADGALKGRVHSKAGTPPWQREQAGLQCSSAVRRRPCSALRRHHMHHSRW